MVRLAFALMAVLVMSSCSSKVGLVGGLYAGYTEGLTATAQMSVKKGEACGMSILGIIATGDASIDSARRNGGIRSISTVDEEFTSILGGLYHSKCTIVRGK
jgi:uncharacterized protein YceK